METTKLSIQVPSILVANCYFWNPCGSASQRRSSEAKKHSVVTQFFISIGFDLIGSNGSVSSFARVTCGKRVEVAFEYRETCKNVYKRLNISISEKRSNITGLIGIMKKAGIEITK